MILSKILSHKQDRIFFAFFKKYFCHTPQLEHSFYITISEKVCDFKAFPNVAVIAFAVLLNPCLFPLFPPFNIQKAVIEPSRSHSAAFLLPVKQEGGLVYGIQNYAEATGINQNPCAQDLL